MRRAGRRTGVGRSPIRIGLALGVGLLALLPSTASASPLPGYGYEVMTPPMTQGQRAIMGGMTDDGNRIMYSSAGAIAGTPSLLDLGIQYIAERTATGWETSSIAPPASEFPFIAGFGVRDISEDLRTTLWEVNTKQDEGTYRLTPIVREPDGSFVVAGPALDGGSYTPPTVGTSADFRTLVLATRNRPALTDGTTDTRNAASASLYLAVRGPDNAVELRQVAYRAGATMSPTCPVQLGGLNTTARGSVSSDGSKVFFSTAGALSACTSAAARRVWAKIGTAEPVDLAASQCTTDCGTAQAVLFEGASRDGSRVYFSTEQKLVDGDQDTATKRDLYEYDFRSSGNKLIPVTSSTNTTGAGVVRAVRVSHDGSHVYFVANGRPLAGPNARGKTPQPGDFNFYVYHREPGAASGTTTFIAALSSTDSWQWGADTQRQATTSTDGRFLLFTSYGDLTGQRVAGDAHQDLFRYDAQTDELLRVWTDDPAHNGAARIARPTMSPRFGGPQSEGGLQRNWDLARQMTEDGSKVYFGTTEPLSPDDVNTQIDAYLWEAETGQITLLSSGTSLVRMRVNMVTPSGDSFVMGTDSPLVKAHTSGGEAAFVLRKGGGFADPPLPPAPCTGDACQGEASAAPGVFAAPGSTVFSGRGNLTAPARKSAGKVSVAKARAVRGSSTRIRVKVPGMGRVRVSGSGVSSVSKVVGGAGSHRLAVKLSKRARATLGRRGRLTVSVVVRFVPSRGEPSQARVPVTFRSKRTSSVRRATAPSSDSRKGR